MSDLFRLTDEPIERLRPFFPKSHGRPRLGDRRVLSGSVFVNRNGLRWRDAPNAQPSEQRACLTKGPVRLFGRHEQAGIIRSAGKTREACYHVQA
jgi:transposase